MKLRALIIDDEPLAHKVILSHAKEVSDLEIVGQCYLATEALSFLNHTEIDLIFLDINMPKLSGLAFLKTLAQPPLVIITSAHEEYALESFELDVCDYLLKPFRFDRFLKAVNKAFALQQLKQPTATSFPPVSHSENITQLFVKVDKKLIQLSVEELYFLESYGNYVKIWVGEVCYLTARTLSSFVDQLPATQFFRVHKSYLLHRKYIDYVEGNQVFMKNGQAVLIGKNYRQAFKRFLLA